MSKRNFVIYILGFFLCSKIYSEPKDLTWEKICQLEESFSESKCTICLGVPEGKPTDSHGKSLYAVVSSGIHLEDTSGHTFDSYEGFVFEENSKDSKDYWMVIDEKDMQTHAGEISEAEPHK